MTIGANKDTKGINQYFLEDKIFLNLKNLMHKCHF